MSAGEDEGARRSRSAFSGILASLGPEQRALFEEQQRLANLIARGIFEIYRLRLQLIWLLAANVALAIVNCAMLLR